LIVSICIAVVNHSFSVDNLQSSDIPIASATSSQEHITTVLQKLHFSPELIVTIKSDKPVSVTLTLNHWWQYNAAGRLAPL
jgi:hypothetical protein